MSLINKITAIDNMPFDTWLKIKDVDFAKRCIDERLGWPDYYLELNSQHTMLRKREAIIKKKENNLNNLKRKKR